MLPKKPGRPQTPRPDAPVILSFVVDDPQLGVEGFHDMQPETYERILAAIGVGKATLVNVKQDVVRPGAWLRGGLLRQWWEKSFQGGEDEHQLDGTGVDTGPAESGAMGLDGPR